MRLTVPFETFISQTKTPRPDPSASRLIDRSILNILSILFLGDLSNEVASLAQANDSCLWKSSRYLPSMMLLANFRGLRTRQVLTELASIELASSQRESLPE